MASGIVTCTMYKLDFSAVASMLRSVPVRG